MRNSIIILVFSFLLFTGCKKEKTNPIETSSLGLSFSANYDGAPLIMNEEVYEYGGKPIRFSKVNFYLSNVTLGGVELSDVSFVDLTDTHVSQESSVKGTGFNFSKIPVDEYKTIAFGVGVSADLNRTKPSDYSTSHPLGSDNGAEYWEAWDSYIFVKIEGQYDVDGDGFDGEDISFAYHIGEDEMYKKLSADFETPVSLVADTSTDIKFRLDIKRLLTKDNGEFLSLSAHDPTNQKEEMRIIMDNFTKAIRYSL